MGARADHADEGVGHGDDLRRNQDLLPGQAARHAAAVDPLEDLAQNLDHRPAELDPGQQLGRGAHALLDLLQFLAAQPRGPGQQGLGHQDLAEVEQGAGDPRRFAGLVVQAHLLGHSPGQGADPLGVLGRVGIAPVDHADQGLDQAVQCAFAALALGHLAGDVALDHQHRAVPIVAGGDRDMVGDQDPLADLAVDPRGVGDHVALGQGVAILGQIALGVSRSHDRVERLA